MGIRDLTATTVVGVGDQIPLFSVSGGDDQRASMAQLAAYMQTALVFTSARLTSQFAVPTTGQTVVVTAGDTWLVLTPAGTLATLTITLPTDRTDGERVSISCTQIITALTVNGGAATINNAPTTLAAGLGFFDMQYSATLNAWFRVN